MKNLLLALTVLFMGTTVANAQKMAHADVNAILSVMPENKKINDDLQIYATGLSQRVQDSKAQLDAIIQQFNQVLSAGDTAKALELQKQGVELDKKFQESSAQAEQQLAQKRGELLQPVLNRIREAMKDVATSKGYDYVLNSVDGAGTSIVLWGPDGSDITREVVEELGIKLEGLEEQPTTEQDAKKKKK